jgi:membrane protein involved in colicin uptake
MSTTENPPAGGDGGAGGSSDKPNTVPRDTYDATVTAEKAARARAQAAESELETLRKEKKEREEAEMRKRGETDELLKKKEEELAAERAKAQRLEAERIEARKYHAFQKSLGVAVDSKWHRNIDLDEIKVDAEGKVDSDSVQRYVEKFRSEYPEILGKPPSANPPPPDVKAGGGTSSLTHDEWMKLSVKEKKARLGDVKL